MRRAVRITLSKIRIPRIIASDCPFCVTRLVVKDGRASVPQWISDMGKKQKNGKTFDQASAVPYRFRGGEIEFCLITSSSKRRWCFPKGIIDPGETPAETALKEAEEEAGLHGEICGQPLGDYEYNKWGRSLSVVVMLMKVHEAADEWEESRLRDRRWVGLEEATQLLGRRRLQDFVLPSCRTARSRCLRRTESGRPDTHLLPVILRANRDGYARIVSDRDLHSARLVLTNLRLRSRLAVNELHGSDVGSTCFAAVSTSERNPTTTRPAVSFPT